MEPRRGNQIIIDFFEKSFSQDKIPFIIYEAPTGYGKTSIIPYLYESSLHYGFSNRLIHVAPLRSLVEHIYLKRLRGDLYPKLSENNVDINDIGFQMMGYGTGKSPYYFKKIITSTIDSFVFNVFKLPVAEMYKHVAHYETPRTNIMSSTVMLDEAHLYGGDPGLNDTSYMFTVLSVLLKVMVFMSIPVLLATATLPQIVVKWIINSVRDYSWIECYRIRIARDHVGAQQDSGYDIVVNDKEYIDQLENIEWKTKIIDEDNIEKIVGENNGRKILIVRNTPRKAIAVFKKIKDVGKKVSLIHGLMRGIDRNRIVRELDNAEVLVGTQVIEVGIDIDFDILITDVASLPALIQRAGRIARKPYSARKAEIYIIKGDGDKIYNREVVYKTLRELGKYENIDWRIPCIKDCSKPSIYALLEKIYSNMHVAINRRGLDNLLIELWELAINPSIGFGRARELYIEQCVKEKKGFLRSTLLVPIYFSEDPEAHVFELGDYSVPLSIWRIRNALEKDIIEYENGKYKVLVDVLSQNEGPSIISLEKKTLLDIVENRCPLLPVKVNGVKLIFMGLIGRIDKYNEELGLEL